MKRRDLLRGLGAATAAGLASPLPGQTATPLPRVPQVNGGMNVQPLRRLEANAGRTPPLIVPELVDLQVRLLYELGFQSMRITISFNRFAPDFLAAIPYVRAARALGLDVLGILVDFAGYDLAQALASERTRREVLATYVEIFDRPVAVAGPAIAAAGGIAFQVLNEPSHFLGLRPEEYVETFLAPTYRDLKRLDPALTVVSAAEVGIVDGIFPLHAMLAAGLERHCDVVAYHVYSRNYLTLLPGLTRKRLWVTESGAAGTENHLAWATETFAEIRAALPAVERIDFFQLLDFEPGRFRLYDLVRAGTGVRPLVESEALVAHYRHRVEALMAGRPHARYEDLVPDVTRYFPTEADLAAIARTSFAP